MKPPLKDWEFIITGVTPLQIRTGSIELTIKIGSCEPRDVLFIFGLENNSVRIMHTYHLNGAKQWHIREMFDAHDKQICKSLKPYMKFLSTIDRSYVGRIFPLGTNTKTITALARLS